MNTLEKIVDASKKLFSEQGFAATRMKEIAALAKINRRTLYRYFPTKEELIFHIYIEAMEQLHNYLNSVAKNVGGENGFEQFHHYLTMIDIEVMRPFLHFTAQFDSRMIDSLSEEKVGEKLRSIDEPKNYILYDIICEGILDGSIRGDLSPQEIFRYLSHSFLAMYQRIVIQQSNRNSVQGERIDYEILFITLTLDSIRNSSDRGN